MIYDIIVIGGGINGAAILRDASLRGLKAVLFEQGDFGQGASANTSKLAHGGLRYLEQLEFRLVEESLLERDFLLTNAPKYCKPLPFLFPIYKGARRPRWQIKLGLSLYDFMARKGPMPGHFPVDKHDILLKFPGLKTEGLRSGFIYYDAQMDDAALLQATVESALELGAQAFAKHKVTGLLKSASGRVEGVTVQDQYGKSREVLGKTVINVSGAWSNSIFEMDTPDPAPFVRPSKGAHLVMPKLLSDTALILTAPQDGRVFFLIPWKNETLVGCTDTIYTDHPDNVSVLDSDIDYLLEASHYYFPDCQWTPKDVLSTFVGLRPLQASRNGNASAVSRDFIIDKSRSGLYSMIGGKYTTHRHMAEALVDRVVAADFRDRDLPKSDTKNRPL